MTRARAAYFLAVLIGTLIGVLTILAALNAGNIHGVILGIGILFLTLRD